MTEQTPEPPKARFTGDQASEAYMPKPPNPADVDVVSQDQGLITDEWAGDLTEEEVAQAKAKP